MGVVDRYLQARAADRDAERKIETARRIAQEKADAAAGARLQVQQQNQQYQAQRDAAAAEARKLSQPVTVKVIKEESDKPLIVTHWKVKPVPGTGTKGQGPLLYLPPGGTAIAAPRRIAQARPALATNPDFQAWVQTLVPHISEVKKRYGRLLIRLRDSQWWGGLTDDAGLGIPDVGEEPWRHGELSGTRKVTTVSLPCVDGVKITPDGLRIKVKHRAKDSLDQWGRALPKLKAALAAVGVDTTHLAVSAAPGGGVVISFGDAPVSFPVAVAPPVMEPVTSVEQAIRMYPQLQWRFGVDAHGREIAARMQKNPHVALIATTGGGKSVTARTLIEQLRLSGVMCFLFDGKGSDLPATLGQLPGVSWLSKSAAEHIVGMRWLWDEMNERYAEADRRKSSGKSSTAFDFPPIFVLVDELPSLRGQMDKADSKDKGELFDFYVNDLLQKGRESRIHLCLVSQSMRVSALPGWWQENLSQVIFLGRVSSRSLDSDAVPEELRSTIANMSQRIPDNAQGRGVYLLREGGGAAKPTEFQGYYGWSEGTTSLDQAPTKEVRAAWEEAAKQAEALPRLYDRIGIEVDSPDWRNQSMSELVETPTVMVTDDHGAIPGMEVYDPLSPEFLGKVPVVAAAGRARGRGSVTPTPTPAPTATREDSADNSESAEESSAQLDVSAMTDTQRDQLLTELLRRPVDTPEPAVSEQVPEPEPEPSSTPPPEPAPEPESEMPTPDVTIQGDDW